MDLERAIYIIHPDTSAEAIREIEFYKNYDKEQVIEEICRAIRVVCDAARKYEILSRRKDDE